MSGSPPLTIDTPICKLLGIRYPVMLAGMGTGRTGPEIVSAVTNAGGLGVFGGHSMMPDALRSYIARVKPLLKDENSPFGIDLLLPQVGSGARATNHDYTEGKLGEITDVICENAKQCKLFVSAVGVPPRWVVEKLHKHGVLVMNMVGAPKHAKKAVAVGVDFICAQGTEGGGHTGTIPTSILVPACVDAVKGAKSELTGHPVYVIAAGGIYDGRGLAMALCQGAQGVWVGTRFLASTEASCSPAHKKAVVAADYTDTVVTLVWSGRPQRTWRTPYLADWEENRQAEIKKLTAEGVVPHESESEKRANEGTLSTEWLVGSSRFPMGQTAGAIHEILPAKEILNQIVEGAVEKISKANELIARL